MATIFNNVMEAATGDGFTNSLNDSSVVTLTINYNTLTTHSASSSNRITSSDDVTLITTISDNQVTSTSGSGFSQTFNDSSIGTVTINNNINVSLFGLSLAENNTANVTYTAINNTLSNSSETNMGLTLSDFSVVNNTVSDNTIASLGIRLSTSASDQTNATYVINNNNNVSSSTNSAMRLGSTGLAVTSATVENNTFTEVPTRGLPYSLTWSQNSAVECVTFQGNKVSPAPTASENNFEFLQSNTSTFNLVNPTLNVGYITTSGTVNTVTSCN